jgi:hypothetical protein
MYATGDSQNSTLVRSFQYHVFLGFAVLGEFNDYWRVRIRWHISRTAATPNY